MMPKNPTVVFAYYGETLPGHGWRHDDSGVLREGERWEKKISGRSASFDVIAHPERNSVEVSVYLRYDTGLLG